MSRGCIIAAKSLMFIMLQALLLSPVATHAAAASHNTTTSHGFSLWGTLKYAADFTHFDYVNPDAPKGGKITLLGFGTFDTLNPHTLKGTSPYNTPGFFLYGISELNETLLAGSGSRAPSGDEIQTGYGLLAESLTYPDDASWVTFRIRPQARFHDGHPVNAEDVVFSYHTLLRDGHPRFKQLLEGVTDVSAISEQEVRFEFTAPFTRTRILRVGELPILPEHYWRNRDFAETTLEPPLLSGPYRITSVEPGQRVTFSRVQDYWGEELAVNKGKYNFDEVKVEYYRDLTVAFEAFKAGNLDVYLDYSSKNWATAYDFPALNQGKVVKEALPHRIPAGVQGFFINTRRPGLSDVRVREALDLLFDFEWTNRQLFYDAYTRTRSYFPNSAFAATGLPADEEKDLLLQYRKQLPEKLFTSPPPSVETDGSGNIRPQLRRAFALFREAGYEMSDGKLMDSRTGEQLELEILFQQKSLERVLLPYVRNLEKAGIRATVRLVDAAQYKNRLDDFDFDITTFVLPQSTSPAQELYEYFHSSNAGMQGGRNYAGINDPVVDALVEKANRASGKNELTVTLRALDRVLLWQHYMVPNWHLSSFRTAYWKPLVRPPIQPDYTLGFANWWIGK